MNEIQNHFSDVANGRDTLPTIGEFDAALLTVALAAVAGREGDLRQAREHIRLLFDRALVAARAGLADLDWLQKRCAVLEMEGEEGIVTKLDYLEADNDGETFSLELPIGAEWPTLRDAIAAARSAARSGRATPKGADNA